MPSEAPPPKKRRKQWRKGATDQTSAVAIASKDRAVLALELRRKGKQFDEIAEALNFSDKSAARKAVVRQIQSIGRESAIEYIGLLVYRIEDLYDVARQIVEDGVNSGEMETALRAAKECRENAMDTARLLGLVKTKVEVEAAPPREALWERVAGWLAEPTPELEQALSAAGWVRVAGAIDVSGSESELSE